MIDIDAHIRSAIGDIVAATPAPSSELSRRSTVADDRRRAWPLAVAMVGMAAAMVVGLAIIATRPTGPSNVTPAAASQPSTVNSQPAASATLFVPASAPDGFRVNQVADQAATVAPGAIQSIMIGKRLPDGGYGPTIQLTSGSPDAILATDGEVVFERRPVDFGSGESAAEFLWWGDANKVLSLQYVSASGRAVSIIAIADSADDPIGAVLLAIANATAVVDTDAQVLTPLPDGYEVLVDGTDPDVGGPLRVVNYVDAEKPGRNFSIAARVDPPSSFPFTAGFIDGLTPIQIRGRQGYTTRHDYLGCNCPTILITWLERSDLQITLTGDSLTLEELLAIAESLQPAGDIEWAALTVAANR
jgi:hypothetical protein